MQAEHVISALAAGSAAVVSGTLLPRR